MNKKFFLFFVLIIFLLFSFRFGDAATPLSAQWFAEGMVNILQGIANGLLDFSFSILEAVISEDFVGVKFTDNDLVNAGWSIMRDFGNIIIVLALIIIALATILDIKEYQAQKTIPILILVALLVNFSPVICGVFIDASNIIMLNFLEAGFPHQMKTGVLEEGLSTLPQPEEAAETQLGIGESFLFLFFSIIASSVVLVYALIFILRYIALWLLIIFSPLAFVFYILPFTRKYFKQWVNQFLQWTFIGVSMSIILFLLAKMQEVSILIQPDTGGKFYGLMARGIAPVIFLVAGFFASLQTGAVGASAITSFASQKARQTGRWTGKKVSEKTGQAIKYGAREGATTVGTVARTGFLSDGFDSQAREETRQAAGRTLENMHLRPVGSTEQQRAKRLNLEQREKEMSHMSPQRINEAIQRPGTKTRDVLAGLNILAKTKHLGGGEHEQGFQNLIRRLQTNETFETYGVSPGQIYRARPDQAPDVFDAVQGQTAGQFRSNTQGEALGNLRVISAMNGAQARAIVLKGSRQQSDTLARGVETNAEHIWQNLDWLDRPGADTRDREAMERLLDVLEAVQQREAILRAASGADIDAGNA